LRLGVAADRSEHEQETDCGEELSVGALELFAHGLFDLCIRSSTVEILFEEMWVWHFVIRIAEEAAFLGDPWDPREMGSPWGRLLR
jgi:hypothetical protein